MFRQNKILVPVLVALLGVGVSGVLLQRNAVPLVSLEQLRTGSSTLDNTTVRLRGYYQEHGDHGKLQSASYTVTQPELSPTAGSVQSDKWLGKVKIVPPIKGASHDDYIEVQGKLDAGQEHLNVTYWRKVKKPQE